MNEKVNLDLKSLKFIFDNNKSYIFPIIVILISLILFLQFVIPQFRSLFQAREELSVESAKLETLKANYNLLTNIDERTLDSQFDLLTGALPPNKDFVGVLNAINVTAQRAGVGLGNFSFRTGDLSKSESADSFPTVKLVLPVNGSIAAVNNFAEIIGKTLPLAKVNSVKIRDVFSTVDLSFYYKPLSVSDFNQYSRVSPVSQEGLTLINELSRFENVSLGQ